MIRAACGERYLAVRGHAGYGRQGQDIVCAGVSALVYALAGTLQETERLAEAVMEPGWADVWGAGDCAREFALVRRGLEMLAERYPQCVEMGRGLPREGDKKWTSGK